MASLEETSPDQLVEFQRVLAQAGFTKEDVEYIIKNPDAAKGMMYYLRLRTVCEENGKASVLDDLMLVSFNKMRVTDIHPRHYGPEDTFRWNFERPPHPDEMSIIKDDPVRKRPPHPDEMSIIKDDPVRKV